MSDFRVSGTLFNNAEFVCTHNLEVDEFHLYFHLLLPSVSSLVTFQIQILYFFTAQH